MPVPSLSIIINQTGCSACTLKSAGAIIFTQSIKEAKQRERKREICIQFKFISFFCMNIKVSFFRGFPLTPHGSMYSLGLLFRPDKQVFFCLQQLLPEDCFECDLTVNEDASVRKGRRGDVMRGSLDQCRSTFCCSSREDLPWIWPPLMVALYTADACTVPFVLHQRVPSTVWVAF